jgi:hypothetical protein
VPALNTQQIFGREAKEQRTKAAIENLDTSKEQRKGATNVQQLLHGTHGGGGTDQVSFSSGYLLKLYPLTNFPLNKLNSESTLKEQLDAMFRGFEKNFNRLI